MTLTPQSRDHQLALSMYLEGLSFDAIQRVFGTLPEGFEEWIQSLGSSISSIHQLAQDKKPPQDKKLILDVVEQKIYIGNQKISSKQIHSQSATIDILNILLENIGKEIDNHHLPSSSYTKNKNQMTSKIISPLKKLVKESFGIELPLSCRGHLYDFCIKLEEHEVPIEVIGKNKPRVHYYEGLEGVKRIYEDHLESKEDISAILGGEANKTLEKYFIEHMNKRTNLGIFAKVITGGQHADKEYAKQDKKFNKETLIIDDKSFSMTNEITVYGKNKTSIQMYSENSEQESMSGVIIESKELHDNIRSIVDHIRKLEKEKRDYS